MARRITYPAAVTTWHTGTAWHARAELATPVPVADFGADIRTALTSRARTAIRRELVARSAPGATVTFRVILIDKKVENGHVISVEFAERQFDHGDEVRFNDGTQPRIDGNTTGTVIKYGKGAYVYVRGQNTGTTYRIEEKYLTT